MNFLFALGFKIIYHITKIWSNFIKTSFIWWCFTFIPLAFIYNVIVTKSIISPYCFKIVFLLLSQLILSQNYIFSFQSKKITYVIMLSSIVLFSAWFGVAFGMIILTNNCFLMRVRLVWTFLMLLSTKFIIL